MKKIPVGILGATGMVGQKYVQLLENHPWFEVAYVAASPQSAGKKYKDALKNGWLVGGNIPESVASLIVEDVSDVAKAAKKCAFVFSAFEMPDKDMIRKYEEAYAAAGYPVFSNASAHRATEDVPMLIPEINPQHLDIIPIQQKRRGWEKGFIVVKPNCSIQSYIAPIFALLQAGYEVQKLIVTTMQAVSGAGYPGVASWDIIDNVVPYIVGEEDKTQFEPYKIFGEIKGGKIVPRKTIEISATCTRVPVSDGHTAVVSLEFEKKKPSREKIIEIWRSFRGEPQKLELPFAPIQPIIYREEPDRPQPRKDRDADKGMAVTVGRLREDNVFDFKFVSLSHNTIRGAAGGGILNAELAFKKGYLP
ncbi:aspartate-semialdehyde dehydrogenase [Candidatus Kaiserbacteria bacterium]|nr:aspartate-semialdehyde dehydrogenase [Candidatus Kaiserbacteria bacterium]